LIPLNTQVVLPYIGNDSASDFPITFPVFTETDVEADIIGIDGLVHALVLGVDFSLSNIGIKGRNGIFTLIDTGDYGAGPVPDPLPISQVWLAAGKLATDYKLYIKFSTKALQPSKLMDSRFLPTTIEGVVDRLTLHILAIKEEVTRSLKYNLDVISELGATTDAGELMTRLIAAEEAIVLIQEQFELKAPEGTPAGSFAETDALEALEWKSGAYEGYSARFGEAFASTGLDDTIKKILNFAYLPPLISLSASPSSAVREKGSTVASVSLSATTTKRSEPITSVTHFRNGILVDTEAAPQAGGGVEGYVDSTPFSDTMSFFSKVYDGTTLVQSNTVTYSYAYPYYEGKGAAGLDSTGIVANLTKVVRSSTATVAVTSSPVSQHFYFCYPTAYPALTSILDPNGFETISGYTVRSVTITGLDGTPQSYRVYELTVPTTQTAFTNTFKR
jgi:hypothetical protein